MLAVFGGRALRCTASRSRQSHSPQVDVEEPVSEEEEENFEVAMRLVKEREVAPVESRVRWCVCVRVRMSGVQDAAGH